MRKSGLFFVATALFMAWGSVSAAEDAYCSKPIRVAMFEYGVLYRSSSGDGVDSRLLDVLEKRTGCVFHRVLMPRARIWAELQAGTLDMATAAISTPERRAFGYFLPYMDTRNQLLIRKVVARVPESMEAFERSDLRVAAVRGFRHETAYDAFLQRLAAQGRVKEVVDVIELLKFLERGIVDAVLSQPLVFREYLDSRFLENDVAIRDWAPKDQLSVGSIILSRKSFTAEQALHWDRVIAAILVDGTLHTVLRGYMSTREAREMIYTGPRDPN